MPQLSAEFFTSVRLSLFGCELSQGQVDALQAINWAWVKYGDGDVRKQAYALATAYHEVGQGLEPKSENLNYTSPSRIKAVWPSRFSLASAIDYVRQPQKLANKVYGGRLGNDAPNDGFLYRGRGYSQITGKENYAKFGKLLGVDLVGKPELAMEPETAAAILVLGVVRGLFTGKELVAGVPDWVAARATVNADGAANGKKIGGYADKFLAALRAQVVKPVTKAEPTKPAQPVATPRAPITPPAPKSPLVALAVAVAGIAAAAYAFLKSQGILP